MSRENVEVSVENAELVQKLAEAFQAALSRGDIGAVFDSDLLAPDAEVVPSTRMIGLGSGRLRGPEGVRELMRVWTENFEHWSVEFERVHYSTEDSVVATFRQSASGKGSGAPVESRLAMLCEIDAGRVTRLRMYADPAEAVEEARGHRGGGSS